MILVDVEVPMMGKSYDCLLDENSKVKSTIESLCEMICQKEQCDFQGNREELTLWKKKEGYRIPADMTLKSCEVNSGTCLLML